ncbi:MAG: hypothetical protein Q4D52_04580 [Eubacteriales bacterium]|nr:hypothetical protein [Eubacteriales bacterium]
MKKRKLIVGFALMMGLSLAGIAGSGHRSVVVYANETVEKTESTKVEKDEETAFIQQVKAEMVTNHISQLDVHVLGDKEAAFKSNVQPEELSAVTENGRYVFVKLNGQVMHGNIIFMMRSEDRLVRDSAEYLALLDDQVNNITEFNRDKMIHATFDIEGVSYLNLRLKASGLSMGPVQWIALNNIGIYTQNLKIDNKFAFRTNEEAYRSYLNLTLDRIQTNDQKIKDMITAAKADEAGIDERERVTRFVVYMGEHTPYDWVAMNESGLLPSLRYMEASDLFSVTERNKAVCVGFSVTAARALNLLGIPSYVVEGLNSGRAPHATIRAFYNKAWHTVDVTPGSNYSRRFFEQVGEDKYDVYDPKHDQTSNTSYVSSYMKIDKGFESWLMDRESKELLVFNQEAALKSKIPNQDFHWMTKAEIAELIKTHEQFISTVKPLADQEEYQWAKKLLSPIEKTYLKLLAIQSDEGRLEEKQYNSYKLDVEVCEKLFNAELSRLNLNPPKPLPQNQDQEQPKEEPKEKPKEEQPIQPESGWIKKNGKWYYFDKKGNIVTAKWIYDTDFQAWYYLKADGSYARNEWSGNYYLKADGRMAKSEWIYDKKYSSWYYLTAEGSYAKNKWIGNYYLKANGKMAKSEWIYDKKYLSWYYLTAEGSYAKNTRIDGYYVGHDGAWKKEIKRRK